LSLPAASAFEASTADSDAAARRALAAVAARDRKVFEGLYRQQHRRLSRFLRRFTARPDVIDEVVNETMWVVWRKAGEFRAESTVDTWITGIACRTMLKSLRGTAPAEELGECLLDPGQLAEAAAAASPEDALAERELCQWVAQGLRHLPADQRLTLELAYALGHTCEEIAEIMGCAVGTVKARMFHARVRLRNVLPVLGGDAAAAVGRRGAVLLAGLRRPLA
jgi:RNA polymerase sigma-70 factor (ECF subfamily)